MIDETGAACGNALLSPQDMNQEMVIGKQEVSTHLHLARKHISKQKFRDGITMCVGSVFLRIAWQGTLLYH